MASPSSSELLPVKKVLHQQPSTLGGKTNCIVLMGVVKQAMCLLRISMISEKHTLETRQPILHSDGPSGGCAAEWPTIELQRLGVPAYILVLYLF